MSDGAVYLAVARISRHASTRSGSHYRKYIWHNVNEPVMYVVYCMWALIDPLP